MTKKLLVLGIVLIALTLPVLVHPVEASNSPKGLEPIVTSLTIVGPSGPITVNSAVLFTVKLNGSWYELVGIIRNKTITVSGWSTSKQCTTGTDGTCKVTLIAPPAAGQYQVTAQYIGDASHTDSSTSTTLNVVSTATIKVNLALITYKIVNAKVEILQGSTVVASRFVTLTSGSRSASMSFTLNGGTYVIRVSGYGMVTQSRTVAVPPNTTASFTIT